MEESNKRILKNTVYLYIRHIVIMALAFISTRIVLEKLGVDDYGIYNVVGGFVALFTVLNNVLQSATRRFLALAIGKGELSLIKRTFDTSLVMHIFIAAVVVFFLETLGLWLLNTTLNIAPERMWAANWVFQFSVLNVIISITQTPYTAVVTAHEHFNVYAFMSIFDVVGKILILFLLVYLPFDKLVVYAALKLSISLLGRMIYRIYCVRSFDECKSFKFSLDKPLFKEMVNFSGWDSLGNVTTIVNSQGITLMLNMFFSTAVNASRGIATTVTSTVSQFVLGFVVAAEPQLAKFYAAGDKDHFERLIFNVTQMTLFLLAVVAVPIWMELDFVLRLWLGTIPDYTPEFVKITILVCFITYSNSMVLKGNVAIGRVKQITMYMAPIMLTDLPLVFLVLELGWSPVAVYWVGMVPCLLRLFVDLYILTKYADFPWRKYVTTVFLKNLVLVGVSCIIPYLVRQQMPEGWQRFFIVSCVSVVCTVVIMYFFALNRESRQLVQQKVLGRFIKKFRG